MASSSNVDVKVTIGVNSKEYRAGLRAANQETKEFKRQQKEMLKTAGIDKGYESIVAAAKKVAPAISAGAAAMAVANKAMKENQTFTDEWARITEGARATFESFVDSLVNADFSGFFNNMGEVINTAREAADAIDNLDTTKIFSNLALSQINLDASKYRYVLRSKTATAEEKEAARQGLIATRDRQMSVALDQKDANLQAFAAQLASYVTRKGYGVSGADFLNTGEDGRLTIKEGSLFQKYYGDLATYRQWDALYKQEKAARGLRAELDLNGRVIGYSKGKGNMSDEAFAELEAFLELSDEKLKEVFGYYQQGLNDLKSVYDAMASDSRYITATAVGGAAGVKASAAAVLPAGSIAAKNQELAEARKAVEYATDDAARVTAQKLVDALEKELERMKNPLYYGNVATGGLDITRTQLTGLRGVNNTQPIAAETDAAKENAKATEMAAEGIVTLTDTIGQLGLLSNVVSPEVQQVTRVLGSFLQMIGSKIGGPWGMALQGVGALVGSFAGGGIIGGTSYKGDSLLAAVNSKELMLNTYQQKKLLDMINSGGGGAADISYVIKGEDLYVTMSNYKRRTRKS